jgi:hypothetical protein
MGARDQTILIGAAPEKTAAGATSPIFDQHGRRTERRRRPRRTLASPSIIPQKVNSKEIRLGGPDITWACHIPICGCRGPGNLSSPRGGRIVYPQILAESIGDADSLCDLRLSPRCCTSSEEKTNKREGSRWQ